MHAMTRMSPQSGSITHIISPWVHYRVPGLLDSRRERESRNAWVSDGCVGNGWPLVDFGFGAWEVDSGVH
jgi:hypothetical protein